MALQFNTPQRLVAVTNTPKWMQRGQYDEEVELTLNGWRFKPTGELLVAQRRYQEEVDYYDAVTADVPQGTLTVELNDTTEDSVEFKLNYDNFGVDAVEFEFRMGQTEDAAIARRFMDDEEHFHRIGGLEAGSYEEGDVQYRMVNQSGPTDWVDAPAFDIGV